MLRRVFCFLRIAIERFGVRAFDADENGKEVRPLEHRQQFGIVGEIERGLGRELERIIVLLDPLLRGAAGTP